MTQTAIPSPTPQGRTFIWDFENRLVQAVVSGQNSGTTTFL
jgi:hypothetical protein